MSLSRFLEFLIVGVIFGVIEDLIAITLATEKSIDLRIVIIALIAAVPFAIISELLVDHDKFQAWFKKLVR